MFRADDLSDFPKNRDLTKDVPNIGLFEFLAKKSLKRTK
jgi:hypothetical protein